MITNTPKPTTTFSNASKVSGAETWATIMTTWASEVRSWLDCVSLFENATKPITTITNTNKPA